MDGLRTEVWGTAKPVKRPPQQPAQPPVRQLLGATDAQTAHPATSSTAPVHQPLGPATAETTPAPGPVPFGGGALLYRGGRGLSMGAYRALCEKLAVLHHREFGKFRRLKGRH